MCTHPIGRCHLLITARISLLDCNNATVHYLFFSNYWHAEIIDHTPTLLNFRRKSVLVLLLVTAYDGEDKQNEKVELKRLTGRRKEAVPSTFLLTPLLRGEDDLIVIWISVGKKKGTES
jgi:hypothetical protein